MANEAGVLRGGADASSYQVGSQGYFAPKAAPSKGNYGQATNAKAIDFSAPPPIAPPPVAPSQQAFDPDAYLAANPKLQEYLKTHPNFDPAKHWIKHGKQEGRPSGQVGSPQVAPSPVAPSPVAPPLVASPGVTPNIPPEMLENIRAAADAYRTGLPQQALRAPLASEPSIPPIDSGRFAGVQQQIEALRGSGGLPGSPSAPPPMAPPPSAPPPMAPPPSAPPPMAPPPMAAPAAQAAPAAPAAGNKGNQQALYAAARAAMAAKPPSVPGGYGGRINVNL